MIELRPRRDHAPPAEPVPLLPARPLLLAILASVVAVAVLLAAESLRVGPAPAVAAIAAIVVAGVAACRALRVPASRRQRIARDLIEGVGLFAAVSLLGVVASYPVAAGRRPLVDAALARADAALGFRWVAWYGWIADHPWLCTVQRAAYLSIYVTPALLIGAFALAGDRARSRRLVATYWVAIVATLVLAHLLPALGPLARLGRAPLPYIPSTSLADARTILALRHHALATIDLDALRGLVCTPSFHASSAVIFAAAAWRVAPLRWPIAALNAAMLLSTPIEGTHYLVDLAGGALVAMGALWLTPLLIARAARERPATPAFEQAAVAAE